SRRGDKRWSTTPAQHGRSLSRYLWANGEKRQAKSTAQFESCFVALDRRHTSGAPLSTPLRPAAAAEAGMTGCALTPESCLPLRFVAHDQASNPDPFLAP